MPYRDDWREHVIASRMAEGVRMEHGMYSPRMDNFEPRWGVPARERQKKPSSLHKFVRSYELIINKFRKTLMHRKVVDEIDDSVKQIIKECNARVQNNQDPDAGRFWRERNEFRFMLQETCQFMMDNYSGGGQEAWVIISLCQSFGISLPPVLANRFPSEIFDRGDYFSMRREHVIRDQYEDMNYAIGYGVYHNIDGPGGIIFGQPIGEPLPPREAQMLREMARNGRQERQRQYERAQRMSQQQTIVSGNNFMSPFIGGDRADDALRAERAYTRAEEMARRAQLGMSEDPPREVNSVSSDEIPPPNRPKKSTFQKIKNFMIRRKS